MKIKLKFARHVQNKKVYKDRQAYMYVKLFKEKITSQTQLCKSEHQHHKLCELITGKGLCADENATGICIYYVGSVNDLISQK